MCIRDHVGGGGLADVMAHVRGGVVGELDLPHAAGMIALSSEDCGTVVEYAEGVSFEEDFIASIAELS
jgi:hypothetical protein